MDLRRLFGLESKHLRVAPADVHWDLVREPARDLDNRLTDEATQWMVRLPDFVCPRLLCNRYPRIANRLAAFWWDPEGCQMYLDSLAVDTRGDRTGLVPAIRAELVKLDRFYQPFGPALIQWKAEEAIKSQSLRRTA
ncbi:MAG: hypothetical protein ABIN37_10265 [Burkholderiaceae bacterium]